MAFSIKTIFQKGGSSEPTPGESPFQAGGGVATMDSPFSMPQGMPQPMAQMGAQPGFGAPVFRPMGEGMPPDGMPVQPRPEGGGAPFSPFATSDQTLLTVSDFLPQLPPDLARMNGAMPDQPVVIPQQAIEAAIASGQMAVPIFEVFRACPALFQGPVSPHDPRLIPLPKGKLAGMIAAKGGQPHMGEPLRAAMPSPFSPQPQPMPSLLTPQSPFAQAAPDAAAPQMMQPTPSGSLGASRPAGALPPRRPNGAPPAIPTQADFIGANAQSAPSFNPAALELPGQRPPMGPGPGSPFAMPSAPPAAGPGGSLMFGSQPGPGGDPELGHSPSAAPMPMASPFGQSQAHSPFTPSASPPPFSPPSQPLMPAMPPVAEPAAASPFASLPGAGNIKVPTTPAPVSFGTAFNPSGPSNTPPMPSVFIPASSQSNVASFEVPQRQPELRPEGTPHFTPPVMTNGSFAPMPAVASPPSRPLVNPNAMPPMAAPPSRPLTPGAVHRGGETVDISIAAILKGYSQADLGFDPTFIPAWINTKIPSSDVRQQMLGGQVMLPLGLLIDGTDAGFRNVIAHGRRDFQVNIPLTLLQSFGPVAAAPEPVARPRTQPLASFMPPAMPAPAAVPSTPPTEPAPQAVGPAPWAGLPGAGYGAPPAAAPAAPSAFPVMPAPAPAAFPAPANRGFGGDQLMGHSQPDSPAPLFPQAPPASSPGTRPMSASPFVVPETPIPAAAELLKPAPAPEASFQSFAPAASPYTPQHAAFAMPAPEPAPMPVAAAPALMAAPVYAPAPAPAASNFGMAAVSSNQMMLKALLGVAETLSVERVVELTSRLPGVSACACVRGLKQVVHGDSSGPALDFNNRAGEIASSMRTLASITGAQGDAISITTPERLITFGFQGEIAFGVLHSDKESSSGLREKVALLGREVASLNALL